MRGDDREPLLAGMVFASRVLLHPIVMMVKT